MVFSKTKNKVFNLELFFIVFLLLITVFIWAVIFFPEILFKDSKKLSQNELKERPAAVANLFYPEDKAKLSEKINELLEKASKVQEKQHLKNIDGLKALIVPHASLGYSGVTAAHAYTQLSQLKNKIKNVVIIAPSNYSKFLGIALSTAVKWQMPFGEVRVDQITSRQLSDLPFVHFLDAPHKNENSIEVQLPFIYETLGNVSIIPALIGDASINEIELFISKALKSDDTFIIVCSNLSQKKDYMNSKKQDVETVQDILNYNIHKLNDEKATCPVAIQGLVSFASQLGWTIRVLDLRNSGDVFIKKTNVIGYASFAISDSSIAPLEREHAILDGIIKRHGKELIKIAFDSIMYGFEHGKPLKVNLKDYPEELKGYGVSFVTINKSGSIRGAMGSMIPKEPLLQDIASNAFLAAFYDNNFNPVNKNELPFISLDISLLTPPYPLSFITEEDLLSKIEQGKDGILFKEQGQQTSLLLPETWSFIKNKRMFLSELKRQAGLDLFYWSPTITASKFLTSTAHQDNYPDLTDLWKNK